jgi:diguanylate cyclase (GGDEF)-like protein/PAS domain S-box-containing protein
MRKLIVSHLLLLMFLVGATSGFLLSNVAWWDLRIHARDLQQLYQAATGRSLAALAALAPPELRAADLTYLRASDNNTAAQQRLVALSLLATLFFCAAAALTYRQALAGRRQAKQLSREHALFKTLFQGTSDGIILLCEDAIIDCNRAALQLFGVAGTAELAALSLAGVQPRHQPDGSASHAALSERLARHGASAHSPAFEWQFRALSGVHFAAEVTIHAARSEHDSVLQLTVRDISARKQAERSMQLANHAFEKSQEGIAITDAEGNILTINRAFSAITGYGPEEVLGRNPRLLASGQQSAEFYANMWTCLSARREWHGEIWNRRKNGEFYPQWLTITQVRDEHDRVSNYVGVFSDISELKTAHARNLRAVYYDALTNLPNRAMFLERLQQLSTRAGAEPGRRIGLMFLNLDRLKVVNDSMGREAGDSLLQMVAARLALELDEADTLARMNGDEFAILLAADACPASAGAAAQAILRRFEEPFALQGEAIHVSLSIGISVGAPGQAGSDDLLQRAAMAMYRAKQAGGVTYALYDEQLDAQASQRLAIETGLRKALARQELELYYQPQIDCRSQQLTGFEALLRWRHPELGLIAPDAFLAVAEETGLIVPIGAWVLQTACAQAQAWRQAGGKARLMAVNLSARQLQHPDIVLHVTEALRQSGLPPHCLELEITESMMMHNMDTCLAVMHQLAALGVEFSIDDFGTGYSSLAYLKKMPIKALKIDRSFIRDIVTDADGAAIVRAIVAMSDMLGLRVVAEGIEEQAQLAHLQGLTSGRAIIGQGYLLGRPAPAFQHAALLMPAPAAELEPAA